VFSLAGFFFVVLNKTGTSKATTTCKEPIKVSGSQSLVAPAMATAIPASKMTMRIVFTLLRIYIKLHKKITGKRKRNVIVDCT
jgi:hypothetical protein